MRQLLAFLIISTLLLGQGFSAGAAMCVHKSARDHAIALESHNKAVSAVAFNEDSAASLASKKAASSAGAHWVADLVAPPVIAPPRLNADGILLSSADGLALESLSTAPLLRPPHA